MFELKKNELSKGFTLMEIVVVLAIFAVASTIISEIFVNLHKSQVHIRDAQQASTEVRYILDIMAREIRSKNIDYAAYSGGITEGSDVLYLIKNNATGVEDKVAFQKISGAACGFDLPVEKAQCLQIRRGGDGGIWNTISSPSLSVENIKFYVAPLQDAFPQGGATGAPDVQPRVTIVLWTSNNARNPRPDELKFSYLQTTVTSRMYVR